MKNVLLIGIGGVYNYGCEAIIRGTVNILKSINPDIDIFYASYNAEDDRRRLSDCPISIIARPKRKRWTFHNILRKCLSYIGVSYTVPYDTISFLSGFDTVFSIGGDIYTLSSNGMYSVSLPLFLEQCQKKGLDYILWGASVGKFEKNPAALSFFCSHLPKINLIVAREKNTVDYLQSLNVVHNVCLAPDPAFFVECPIAINKHESGQLTIGINLSPLSALYEYENLDVAIQRQSEAIINLMKGMQCRIILLPHVISPSVHDNDFMYLKSICQIIEEPYRSNIILVDSDPGFVGLKSFISKCDFVIAARMHCAVNAITMSVPTLFLSYSEKARGMAEFVYSSNETVISLSEFENTSLVVEKLKNWKWISRLNEIKQFDFNKILK